MSKKKLQQFDKVKPMLYGVVIGLSVILISVLIVQLESDKNPADHSAEKTRINLGVMAYDFSGEKAVERTDETVTGLQAFLQGEAEQAISANCPTSHFNVMAANEDETQVLLRYGCSEPSDRMFAIREADFWRTISPTNQFDPLGIPACEHVDENGIDKSIAPVCVNGLRDGPGLLELSYSVR